jgi:carbamoyltransferase
MVTQFLGFRKDSDEGKVMGLAAYGEPRYLPELREVCRLLPKGLFEVRRPWSQSFWSSEVYFDEALEKLLGEPRRKDEPIERRHEDLAASVQTLAEEVLLHVSRRLHTLTGASALCLAGGVALNSVANGRLRREGPFDDLFVPPAAGDQGTAIGAALYVWHQKLGEPRSWTMTTPFLGPSFGSERCEEAAAASGYHYRREADICDTAAQLLAQGKILGWLSGRMEIGPRALGHRSILAAPSPAEMRDVLNAKVKFREPFRPFAPAVCEEDAARYFTADKPSPYMLEVHDVRPEWHEQLAAITHVDGTARLQTVSRDVSPRLWELLRAYERLSGIPVLLNTSFNLAGDPIVCTPEDALELLPKSELDFVVIEDIVVGRTPPEEWGI